MATLAPGTAQPNPLDRIFEHCDGVYHVRLWKGAWLLGWGENEVGEFDSEAEAVAEMKRLAAIWREAAAYKVYFIGTDAELGSMVKIGVARNVRDRLHNLRTASPVELRVIATRYGDRKVEKTYHSRFHASRVRGEWFRISPAILAEIERLQGEA